MTTNFEPNDASDVINKTCLDEKFLEINVHKFLLEKDYKDFKLLIDKQAVEEVLIQRTVKTIMQ